MSYLDTQNDTIKQYYKILSKEFPSFLLPYIETPAMQRLTGTSMSCGMDHIKLFKTTFWYSNLDHSIGVALIVWHFTKDKKATLAALFHDISNPAFKHCVDFLNGDPEKQESIDEHTIKFITGSKEIMALLKRDNISIHDVSEYKKYPIADNDTPKLSADRLEYTFSTGMVQKKVWELNEIEKVYKDLTILKNEDGIDELGFRNQKMAELFLKKASHLWPIWISNADKMMMETYAEIFRMMGEYDILHKEDLYVLSENEVIHIIENCKIDKIKNAFRNFRNASYILESDKPIENKYCKSLKTKTRYIIPLVKLTTPTRVVDVSLKAKKIIEDYKAIINPKYVALDFQI